MVEEDENGERLSLSFAVCRRSYDFTVSCLVLSITGSCDVETLSNRQSDNESLRLLSQLNQRIRRREMLCMIGCSFFPPWNDPTKNDRRPPLLSPFSSTTTSSRIQSRRKPTPMMSFFRVFFEIYTSIDCPVPSCEALLLAPTRPSRHIGEAGDVKYSMTMMSIIYCI